MSSRNPVVEFNYYLDTATSPKKIESAGHFSINKLCWMIDEGIVKPEDAIQAIHCKIVEGNSEIVLLALEVLNAVFYKCGSLAHKVICTEFYMSLLKEIILTTDNRNIKETILHMLQEWADKFKYFPQYSEPQKLLQEIKENEKSTNKCKNSKTNGIHQASKPLKNNEKFDKNRLNETDFDLIKAASNECSSDNQTDAEFQEREEDFKKALREYQQKRKIDYNNYRKTMGLPPLSSDEEDNDDKKGARSCKSKQEEASMPHKSTSSLPKELQLMKDQRERLNSNIQQFRECKHNNYVQSSGATKEMQQCKDKNCTNCQKYKRKDDPEEDRITKQKYPYDIRKIVESKERMKKSIEEIKKSKQEAYYNKQKPLSSITNNDNKMEVDDYELRDSESEDEALKRAILLNKIENTPKTMTAELKQNNDVMKTAPSFEEIDETKYLQKVLAASLLDTGAGKSDSAAEKIQENDAPKDTPSLGEIDETKYLKQVLAASLLDTGAGKSDLMTAEQKQIHNAIKNTASSTEMDEETILQQAFVRNRLDPETEEIDENELLQQVINKSFAEEEEKNFSPMPKTNEEYIIEYVKQMSLAEKHKSQSNDEERTRDVKDLRLCLVCLEERITKQFIPCNHKCICYECAEKYTSHRCIFCNRHYTSLI